MDFSLKIEWVRAIWKSGSKLQDNKEKNENEVKIKPMQLPSSRNYVFGLGDVGLVVKLNFKGVLISYFALRCSQLPEKWNGFDFDLIFTHLLDNWVFAARFSNCSNSLNF